MRKPKQNIPVEQPDALFGRVVSILEQAQGNVVRAVNTNMVLAYWLIGRFAIRHPAGDESLQSAIPRPSGGESSFAGNLSPAGRELTLPQKSYPSGSEFLQDFSPQLTWSHYRALMRVDSIETRDFYEQELVAGVRDVGANVPVNVPVTRPS